MTWIIVGSVIVTGLFLSAFFSGTETGLYRVNRLRLHLGVKQRDPQALRLASVLDDEQGALSVTLVGTNMANYVTTSAVAFLFAELLSFGEANTELYTVAILTPIVFVFGEVVPKNLFRLHADTLLARGSRLLLVADRLLRITGVVPGLTRLAGAFNRLAGGPPQGGGALLPKRRVAMLLQEALTSRDLQAARSAARAEAHGSMGEDQSDLIDRVCRLSETPLTAVMVPRNRVTVIAADTDRRGLMRIARRTGHACLPVYESDRRHIIGVAKVDELLSAAGGPEAEWRTVRDYAPAVRSAMTLSPHETVAAAITQLQRAGRSMAIVTDRGGQMLGVVTLKDLLDEVVGGFALGGLMFE